MDTFRGVTGDKPILTFGPEDVEAEDIATGLSKVNRYNGQYEGDFMVSVGQHSVLVSHLMEQDMKKTLLEMSEQEVNLCLIGLIHDGSEAYLGDMITPFKRQLPDFTALENQYQSAVYTKYLGRDITEEEHTYLDFYDHRVLDMECRELGRPACYHLVHEIFNDMDRVDEFQWWSIRTARLYFLERLSVILFRLNTLRGEKAA